MGSRQLADTAAAAAVMVGCFKLLLPAVALLAVLGWEVAGQQVGGSPGRRLRRLRGSGPAADSTQVAEEEAVGRPGGGRTRARRPGGGRRPAARQIRGRHRMRGGGRRFPGGARVRRPPIDYYQDYYDDYYYYDYDYDQYEDDPVEAPEAVVAEKKKKPFSLVVPKQQQAAADVGEEDYPSLIKELWRQFLEEKEGPSEEAATSPVKEQECVPLNDVSYYEPDEEQCDKYYECNIKGEIRDHLCPDGFAFDPTLQKCDYPVKVNCTSRPLLQEPQPSKNCSRANGFFPWPANESCQNFWDCREGRAYLQSCPVGVIFDPQLNTCATPDQSTRTECTEGKDSFLGFQCPSYSPESVLRFGNHDRLPHPDNCQQYFTCLRTGGPRLATCPRKKVFNNGTGQCGDPKDVEGCENYWIERLKEEEESEYYYDDE